MQEGASQPDLRALDERFPSARAPAEMRSVPDLNLADAVASAVARHPDMARALADLARSRAERGVARGAWLPRLSYEATVDPNNPSFSRPSGLDETLTNSGVSLRQLLWDFGRTRSEVAAASAVQRQRRYELEAVAAEVAEAAALAYLDVARAEELERETARHVESLQRLRELIRLRSEAGLSDQSDLLLADVRVEAARADHIQAQTAQRSASLSLTNLTGVLADRYVDPAPVIDEFAVRSGEPDLDEIPEIAAAAQAERAARARVDQAKKSRRPRIGVQLAYNRNYYTREAGDDPFTPLLTVTGNLYRGGTSHAVRAAREERRAVRSVKESTELDLRGRVLAAREEIRGGELRIEAYRRQEQRAIETSRIFLEEYKIGQRNLSDLLNAELEVYRAASARVAAENDVRRAKVRLEAAYGALRASLGLESAASEVGP